jgi:hypothetical protein
MENAGCRWDKNEDQQLIKLYTKYKMDIFDIASIHKRSSESIRLRLIKFNLIKDTYSVSEIHEIREFGTDIKKFNEMCMEFRKYIYETNKKLFSLETEITSLKNQD